MTPSDAGMPSARPAGPLSATAASSSPAASPGSNSACAASSPLASKAVTASTAEDR